MYRDSTPVLLHIGRSLEHTQSINRSLCAQVPVFYYNTCLHTFCQHTFPNQHNQPKIPSSRSSLALPVVLDHASFTVAFKGAGIAVAPYGTVFAGPAQEQQHRVAFFIGFKRHVVAPEPHLHHRRGLVLFAQLFDQVFAQRHVRRFRISLPNKGAGISAPDRIYKAQRMGCDQNIVT